jgi:hypothetical protein
MILFTNIFLSNFSTQNRANKYPMTVTVTMSHFQTSCPPVRVTVTVTVTVKECCQHLAALMVHENGK